VEVAIAFLVGLSRCAGAGHWSSCRFGHSWWRGCVPAARRPARSRGPRLGLTLPRWEPARRGTLWQGSPASVCLPAPSPPPPLLDGGGQTEQYIDAADDFVLLVKRREVDPHRLNLIEVQARFRIAIEMGSQLTLSMFLRAKPKPQENDV